MIRLTGVSKTFKNKVLKEIEYEFKPGKIYVIKGVSGCGKSTLLNILGGLDRDYEGEYLFFDQDIKKLGSDEFSGFRKKVGYVYQNSLLLSKLTLMENLCFIKNCPEAIKVYADKLGVSKLLNKYPEQLSGGERQRFAVIRALLNNPTLIIADEPTASLDNKNSKKMASVMAAVSRPDNIVIISTHEDCFDDIATEIIDLNYGRIGSVIQKENSVSSTEAVVCEEAWKYSTLKYVFSRNKEKLRLAKLLPTTIALLVLLLSLAVQRNFQEGYIKRVTDRYPMTVFSLANYHYEGLRDRYELMVYDNYVIEEDGFICLALLDEKNSGLSYGEVIQYGVFPQKANEVVVSQEYVNDILGLVSYEDGLGKTLSIGSDMYTIVGVLSDLKDETDYNLVYYNDYYDVESPCKVFIPHETIKERGRQVESPVKMVAFDELYEKKENYLGLREELCRPISVWDAAIIELQALIDFIYLVAMAAVSLVAFIALLFIRNEVQLELFYRRKELGYLQVFNVSKTRLKWIFVCERLLRTVLTLVYALTVYIAFATVSALVFKINGFLPITVIALFSIAILLYGALSVYYPCRKFLRQEIITLIT